MNSKRLMHYRRQSKITLAGVELGRERRLEKGLGFRPLQITERDGARGIASACAIFYAFPLRLSVVSVSGVCCVDEDEGVEAGLSFLIMGLQV